MVGLEMPPEALPAARLWARLRAEQEDRWFAERPWSRLLPRPLWRAGRGWLAQAARRLRPPRYPAPIPQTSARREMLANFLASKQRLRVPPCDRPDVSILLPSHNRALELLECLLSLQRINSDIRWELLILDNASTDEARQVLDRLEGAHIELSPENLGFVHGNNHLARRARGRWLLFLNNDALLAPDCLDALTATMVAWPDCGAVASRLVFPDGRLQEAGAIVWRSGEVDLVGLGENADAPEFQHVREVDHGSAACLLVDAGLFRRVGGFDSQFAPCYYEDVDLCFAIRQLGRRVLYQPRAMAWHHGPSNLARAASFCQTQRRKFIAKWSAELARHSPGGKQGDRLLQRDRRPGLRLLMVGPSPKEVARCSEEGAVVTAICENWPPAVIEQLRQAGVEVLPGGLTRICRERTGCYEAITAMDISPEMLAHLRLAFPRTPISSFSQ